MTLSKIYMVEYELSGDRTAYLDRRDAILSVIRNYFNDEFKSMKSRVILNAEKGNFEVGKDAFDTIENDMRTLLEEGYIEDYAYIDVMELCDSY